MKPRLLLKGESCVEGIDTAQRIPPVEKGTLAEDIVADEPHIAPLIALPPYERTDASDNNAMPDPLLPIVEHKEDEEELYERYDPVLRKISRWVLIGMLSHLSAAGTYPQWTLFNDVTIAGSKFAESVWGNITFAMEPL